MSDFRSGLPIRLFDEDNLPYTANNPVPVTLEESEGDEIHDYNEAVDVAKRVGVSVTSANHDYTVSVGKDFLLEKVLYAGSGRMKCELQIETGVGAGTFNTKAVAFSSTAKLSDEISLLRSIKVAAGVKVRVVVSNLDNDDQSLYSTIIGVEKTA